MTLSQWDKEVRPHLHFIESGAAMAARHARLLPAKPDFETIAESELAEARTILQNALEQIVKAQAVYQSKTADA